MTVAAPLFGVECPKPIITRSWAMPSPWTFTIKPVKQLLSRYLQGMSLIVDPFAGRSSWGHVRNDIVISGVCSLDWLHGLVIERGEGWAEAVILDPPYSNRQLSEVYRNAGGAFDGRNASFYRQVIELLDRVLAPGGVAIRCGWNSCGFGRSRGYKLCEVLLVCHGGAHNDTIVTVETKARA